MKLGRALLVWIVISQVGCKQSEVESKEPATEKPGAGTGTASAVEPAPEKVAPPVPATDDAAVCKRYGDLEARCGGYTGDEIEATRVAATGYCLEARAGEEQGVMAALVKLEAVCAAEHAECAPYAACVEKAKQDNAPPAE